MKVSPIIVLSVMASGVVALDNCNRGGVYCGVSLLRRGNASAVLETYIYVILILAFYESDGDYEAVIKRELTAARQPTDGRHINYARFDCLADGKIKYRQFCSRGCGGVASTDPDYCF